MKLGIPRGLLYYKYYPFINTFFDEIGAEIIISPDTNKALLDQGVKYCVDDACLPIKVFHGHVAFIKDKCDIVFIPRVMQLFKGEFICPKFCGLPEMIKNNINNMPRIIDIPIYAYSNEKLKKWALDCGSLITKNKNIIDRAFNNAIREQQALSFGINDTEYPIKVALVGHPYNIYDSFINMNLIKKLHKLGIGVITEEKIKSIYINESTAKLYKKPFWTFARNSYGFCTYLAEKGAVDGIIYISSFACGIDSIVIELIKERMENFPVLILKIDEMTGEAGFDTRLEAFFDMLEGRCCI